MTTFSTSHVIKKTSKNKNILLTYIVAVRFVKATISHFNLKKSRVHRGLFTHTPAEGGARHTAAPALPQLERGWTNHPISSVLRSGVAGATPGACHARPDNCEKSDLLMQNICCLSFKPFYPRPPPPPPAGMPTVHSVSPRECQTSPRAVDSPLRRVVASCRSSSCGLLFFFWGGGASQMN